MQFAPIILFVYNRPEHTQMTLKSLSENVLASESDLIVFADGPKANANEEQRERIKRTRNICRTITGFKSVTLNEAQTNKGLAKNIIYGVTDIVSKYGKVIVLEDDILTSQFFLSYMNKALSVYENEKSVWHVSGWMYPFGTDEYKKCGFHSTMNCWGWGTWADRWNKLNTDANHFIKRFSKDVRKKFSFNYKADFWLQMLLNNDKVYNTWAVFWYATIFENDGLCLAPYKALTSNIGFDGSGEHSSKNNAAITYLNQNKIELYPESCSIDSFLQDSIEAFITSNASRLLFVKYVLEKVKLYKIVRKFSKIIK